MPTRVGQVIDYSPDQTITYGGISGLGDIANTALAIGAKGDEVKKVQSWLVKVGYPIDVDGAYGPKTALAVLYVQRKLNAKANATVLNPSGLWDSETNKLASEQSQSDIVAPNSVERALVSRATAISFEEERTGKRLTKESKQTGTTTVAKDITLLPAVEPERSASPAVGQSKSVLTSTGDAGASVGGPGVMDRYKAWLEKQPLPDFLKNPWVATGAVTAAVALLGFGVYKLTRPGGAAQVMAGMDELGAMRSGYAPSKKRKSRKKKSRQSKK